MVVTVMKIESRSFLSAEKQHFIELKIRGYGGVIITREYTYDLYVVYMYKLLNCCLLPSLPTQRPFCVGQVAWKPHSIIKVKFLDMHESRKAMQQFSTCISLLFNRHLSLWVLCLSHLQYNSKMDLVNGVCFVKNESIYICMHAMTHKKINAP